MQGNAPWAVLLLAGPPGAGKNTVADAIAARLERCAVIDVDRIRGMVVKPHRAPWDGAEGQAQHQLGARNACLLVPAFVAGGYQVVICDALSDDTLRVYRSELAGHGLRIVLLMPTLQETQRRNAQRSQPQVLERHEVEVLYHQHLNLRDIDQRIDNTQLLATVIAALLAP